MASDVSTGELCSGLRLRLGLAPLPDYIKGTPQTESFFFTQKHKHTRTEYSRVCWGASFVWAAEDPDKHAIVKLWGCSSKRVCSDLLCSFGICPLSTPERSMHLSCCPFLQRRTIQALSCSFFFPSEGSKCPLRGFNQWATDCLSLPLTHAWLSRLQVVIYLMDALYIRTDWKSLDDVILNRALCVPGCVCPTVVFNLNLFI